MTSKKRYNSLMMMTTGLTLCFGLIGLSNMALVSAQEVVEEPMTTSQESLVMETTATHTEVPQTSQKQVVEKTNAASVESVDVETETTDVMVVETTQEETSANAVAVETSQVSIEETTVEILKTTQQSLSKQAHVQKANAVANQYVVRKGDYLYKIAKQFGITVQQLKDWNKLTSNYIYTGNKLIVAKSVPVKAPVAKKPKSTETKLNPVVDSAIKSYTVQKGDYLWKIANRHGITVQQLKDWNKLTSNYIYTGNRLIVSAPKAVTKPVETPKPTPVVKPEETKTPVVKETPKTPIQESKTYTVQRGDYLWKIATRHGISVNQLREWNNLTSNYIYTGDKLRVSAPQTVAKPAPVVKPEAPKPTTEETTKAPTVETKRPVETVKEAEPVKELRKYTVQKGDYLWKIATQHGITVNQLKEWNNLGSNFIKSGQTFIVENPNGVKPSAAISAASVEWPALDKALAGYKQWNMPLINQNDPRWKDAYYGNSGSKTIQGNGCGIVTLAMIDSAFKGKIVNPIEIANWAGLRHYVYNVGTAWTIFGDFAKSNGYEYTYHGRDFNSAMKEIEKGRVGVVSMGPGKFTRSGHFLAIRGFDKGKVLINDANDSDKKRHSHTPMTPEIIKATAKGYWTFAKTLMK